MLAQRSLRLLVFALCAVLYACGGNNNGAIPTPPASTADAKFIFEVPFPASQQTQNGQRNLKYISSATLSLSITLVTVNGATPAPTRTAQVVNVTSSANGCAADPVRTGDVRCTITTKLPVGTDVLTVSTYDASNAGGHLLSQQIFSAGLTAGTANAFSFTLDANPNNATISVVTTGSATGNQSGGFTILTTGGAQTFAVSLADAAGETILNSLPGYPSLSVISHSSGVATASLSGNTLTVTPVSAGTSSLTITAMPASGGDGLVSGNVSFNLTAVVPTPTSTPTPTDLIAVGELNESTFNASKIVVYGYTEGSGTAPSVYGTIPSSSLPTNAWPYGIAFSSSGNLWVADNNSGKILQFLAASLPSSSPTASVTIVGPASPVEIAVSANEFVGVANTGASTDMSEFSSNGTAQASYVSNGSTGQGIAYIPGVSGFSTDSAAFVHSAPSSSEIIICNRTFSSTCSSNTIVTTNVNSPGNSQALLAWNASNNQLVLANSNSIFGGENSVYSYAFSGAALSTSTNILNLSNPPTALAISPDGHVAVASCRTAIPFNSETNDMTCTVSVVTASGNAVTGWSSKAITGICGLTFLPNNQLVIATNTSNTGGALVVYTLSSPSSPTASVNISGLAPISLASF